MDTAGSFARRLAGECDNSSEAEFDRYGLQGWHQRATGRARKHVLSQHFLFGDGRERGPERSEGSDRRIEIRSYIAGGKIQEYSGWVFCHRSNQKVGKDEQRRLSRVALCASHGSDR